jgi:L-fucose mutarotase
MLRGIDPLLSPDLLFVLAAMGHGDDIAVVDGLHPAERIAKETPYGRVVRLPGVDIVRAIEAIVSVMPLDDFVEQPVRRMQVVGFPDEIPDVQRRVQRVLDVAAGKSSPMGSIERFAFYEEERRAFAVVQVGDTRPYGCFLLRKGIIRL